MCTTAGLRLPTIPLILYCVTFNEIVYNAVNTGFRFMLNELRLDEVETGNKEQTSLRTLHGGSGGIL